MALVPELHWIIIQEAYERISHIKYSSAKQNNSEKCVQQRHCKYLCKVSSYSNPPYAQQKNVFGSHFPVA